MSLLLTVLTRSTPALPRLVAASAAAALLGVLSALPSSTPIRVQTKPVASSGWLVSRGQVRVADGGRRRRPSRQSVFGWHVPGLFPRQRRDPAADHVRRKRITRSSSGLSRVCRSHWAAGLRAGRRKRGHHRGTSALVHR